MIVCCAFGRASLLAWMSFPAKGSFGRDHRYSFPHIDAVNIRLTGVAFADRHIFTLSILGGATRFRDPGHAPPTPGPGSLAAGSSPRRAGRNVVRLHVRRRISSARSPLAAALRALMCRRQFRNPAIWPVEGTSRRCHIVAIHSLSWTDSYGRTRQPPSRIL